ncbi:Uncharacterised protein [Kingella potus]|uniref:Uncharacterized protein n=1 Tax=Kingella potus TaxID=265175 RepID=A0A377R0H7_9NEIS|nr:hypothetical protein [Kingella potus]UOP01069.1 hypothetical protein LVJ84_01520 [Kingella potus]STR00752.1 Uncharacterised protein [Kingella potus]
MSIRPDLFCAAAYTALFLAAVVQSRRYSWLLAAVFCWLLAGSAGAWLLPGFLSPFSVFFLYMPQVYIAPACLLFLLLYGRSTAGGAYCETAVRPLPVLFASSCVAMALSHALVLFLAWQAWPTGLAPRLLPALGGLSLLHPAYWLSMQILLMAVSALHGKFNGQPGSAFSIHRIQAGLLLALVAQAAYIATVIFPRLTL